MWDPASGAKVVVHTDAATGANYTYDPEGNRVPYTYDPEDMPSEAEYSGDVEGMASDAAYQYNPYDAYGNRLPNQDS